MENQYLQQQMLVEEGVTRNEMEREVTNLTHMGNASDDEVEMAILPPKVIQVGPGMSKWGNRLQNPAEEIHTQYGAVPGVSSQRRYGRVVSPTEDGL